MRKIDLSILQVKIEGVSLRELVTNGMLPADVLALIGKLSTYRTQVSLKLTCRDMYNRLDGRMGDDSPIDRNFLRAGENSVFLYEYFKRRFVDPHQDKKKEPYLIHFCGQYDCLCLDYKIIYASCPAEVVYLEQVEDRGDLYFRSLEDDYSDVTIRAQDLWVDILRNACRCRDKYIFKIDPRCRKIRGHRYVLDFVDEDLQQDKVKIDLSTFLSLKTQP